MKARPAFFSAWTVKLWALDPLVKAIFRPFSSATELIDEPSGTSTAELVCGIMAT